MKWYAVQFDKNWATCRNHNCKAQFVVKNIAGKRKCPVCKMDNYGCIKPKANRSSESP